MNTLLLRWEMVMFSVTETVEPNTAQHNRQQQASPRTWVAQNLATTNPSQHIQPRSGPSTHDAYRPGLAVRFRNINEQVNIPHLVGTCCSAAVLAPHALGVLEDVELGRED